MTLSAQVALRRMLCAAPFVFSCLLVIAPAREAYTHKTHSPQPHLDGGYTVFGRVVGGMNVVDGIARGETINTIVISNNGIAERP